MVKRKKLLTKINTLESDISELKNRIESLTIGYQVLVNQVKESKECNQKLVDIEEKKFEMLRKSNEDASIKFKHWLYGDDSLKGNKV